MAADVALDPQTTEQLEYCYLHGTDFTDFSPKLGLQIHRLPEGEFCCSDKLVRDSGGRIMPTVCPMCGEGFYPVENALVCVWCADNCRAAVGSQE